MNIKEIEDIRNAVPFVPFAFELNSGKTVSVPTGDHLFIPPSRRYVIVATENLYVIDPASVSALVIPKSAQS